MNTLLESLPELENQLEAAERLASEAQHRADALRKIIEGVRALNGHAAEVTLVRTPVLANGQPPVDDETAEHPRGREAVRMIIGDRPGVWTLTELAEEMRQRGWFTSRKAVEVAVARLCGKGEGMRLRTGVYRFPANYGEEGAGESDTSGAAMIALT